MSTNGGPVFTFSLSGRGRLSLLPPRQLRHCIHTKHCIQGRRLVTSLGHQEGRRVFREGPKFFELCPIVLNYVQHIFPGRANNFLFPCAPLVTGLQGCNEVRWLPGQEASLEPPCSNLRSFERKCAVLKKVLVTLLGLFGAPDSDSTRGKVFPLAYPSFCLFHA